MTVRGFYISAYTTGKNVINIDDIIADQVLFKKLQSFFADLLNTDYLSLDEYAKVLQSCCNKHNIHPKTRLDINLIYWRLLGDNLIKRHSSFERFSRQYIPTDIEDIGSSTTTDEKIKLEGFVKSIISKEFKTAGEYKSVLQQVRREFHIGPGKLELCQVYKTLLKRGTIERHIGFEQFVVKKQVRSESGVLVVTVLTSPFPETDGKPGRFDCAYDCAYCPSEPGMPRSYISTEPAVRRAIQNNWDPIAQFEDRVSMLRECGHVVDKLEVLVLGGTWSSYPMAYRENFVRDIFYAANNLESLSEKGKKIPKKKLLEERIINETSKHRIIGVTLETRPDCINKRELRHFRECGCTRVQLGIQHTSDAILDKINRRCLNKHNKRGIKMLKEAGFKVDIHLMPDLPGSNEEIDMAMFEEVLNTPDLQADQWKIYPTSVVRHSQIEKWYEEGSYKPYADIDGGIHLVELIMKVKTMVHPWIRLNRVIRDIPEISIFGGNADTNMRQKIAQELRKRKTPCHCIRCREARQRVTTRDIEEAELVVREYASSGGVEYFISFESPEVNIDTDMETASVKKRRKRKRKPRKRRLTVMGMLRQLNHRYKTNEFDYQLQFIKPIFCLLALLILIFAIIFHMAIPMAYVVIACTVIAICLIATMILFKMMKKPKKWRKYIYAFLRLRVNGNPGDNIFPELRHASLIRELHVYGRLIAVSDKKLYSDRPQHSGFGRKLIDHAIKLTVQNHGLSKIAVISGDGVKGYYRKLGFNDEDFYLTRTLNV